MYNKIEYNKLKDNKKVQKIIKINNKINGLTPIIFSKKVNVMFIAHVKTRENTLIASLRDRLYKDDYEFVLSLVKSANPLIDDKCIFSEPYEINFHYDYIDALVDSNLAHHERFFEQLDILVRDINKFKEKYNLWLTLELGLPKDIVDSIKYNISTMNKTIPIIIGDKLNDMIGEIKKMLRNI